MTTSVAMRFRSRSQRACEPQIPSRIKVCAGGGELSLESAGKLEAKIMQTVCNLAGNLIERPM
jgi:hypothetical protein